MGVAIIGGRKRAVDGHTFNRERCEKTKRQTDKRNVLDQKEACPAGRGPKTIQYLQGQQMTTPEEKLIHTSHWLSLSNKLAQCKNQLKQISALRGSFTARRHTRLLCRIHENDDHPDRMEGVRECRAAR